MQDVQCTYNVTLRRVRVTIVSMEKQEMWNTVGVCILVLVVPHAKRMRRINYIAVRGLAICLCHIVLHFVMKDTILNTKCVCFHFLYCFCLKHFSF